MKTTEFKKLFSQALTPLSWVLVALLAIWTVGGLVLTAVLMFLGGFATFFLGGFAGWVIGLIGAVLFLVLPWQALNLIVKGGSAVNTWAARDKEAEARDAELSLKFDESLRKARTRVLI